MSSFNICRLFYLFTLMLPSKSLVEKEIRPFLILTFILMVWFMVFNATLNNISAILWHQFY